MTQTPFKCTNCGSKIIEIREDDPRPPFMPYTYYACSGCGFHHEVDVHAGKISRVDRPAIVRDISPEEALQWSARGGCPAMCGRRFPWEG